MGKFIVRMVNLIAICTILFAYNYVISGRLAEEEKLYGEVMSQIKENNTLYKDGRYYGQADGFGGIIEVSVLINDGQISEIEIEKAESEDMAYLSTAKGIINDIIKKQTSEVDTVTGATFSSTGIKNAVAAALEEAYIDEEEK